MKKYKKYIISFDNVLTDILSSSTVKTSLKITDYYRFYEIIIIEGVMKLNYICRIFFTL